MERSEIIKLLNALKEGDIDVQELADKLSPSGDNELGFAHIDSGRSSRTGIPEVIYAAGKTGKQVAEIAQRMNEKGIPIMATRATKKVYKAVKEKIPGAEYHPLARVILHQAEKVKMTESYIAVVTAGTSDIPVAEEAALTAEFLGNRVERIFDVGVAGIHRLFGRIDLIRGAKAIVVVAGMEGALTSVVGGLVDKPVIGVPTSVGYGANFGGISALLAMLNSCANGVSIVNIDNGFGAACQASLINKI
jgi:NCAIR mutase (PurE)-related protein